MPGAVRRVPCQLKDVPERLGTDPRASRAHRSNERGRVSGRSDQLFAQRGGTVRVARAYRRLTRTEVDERLAWTGGDRSLAHGTRRLEVTMAVLERGKLEPGGRVAVQRGDRRVVRVPHAGHPHIWLDVARVFSFQCEVRLPGLGECELLRKANGLHGKVGWDVGALPHRHDGSLGIEDLGKGGANPVSDTTSGHVAGRDGPDVLAGHRLVVGNRLLKGDVFGPHLLQVTQRCRDSAVVHLASLLLCVSNSKGLRVLGQVEVKGDGGTVECRRVERRAGTVQRVGKACGDAIAAGTSEVSSLAHGCGCLLCFERPKNCQGCRARLVGEAVDDANVPHVPMPQRRRRGAPLQAAPQCLPSIVETTCGKLRHYNRFSEGGVGGKPVDKCTEHGAGEVCPPGPCRLFVLGCQGGVANHGPR
mmetsp:Transcript_11379/g.36155  ORF Transcript_11379/g.36155 Transcript_11379/m.36155 type:complete len:418 (-) Transcript_11379:321-1574(-)